MVETYDPGKGLFTCYNGSKKCYTRIKMVLIKEMLNKLGGILKLVIYVSILATTAALYPLSDTVIFLWKGSSVY